MNKQIKSILTLIIVVLAIFSAYSASAYTPDVSWNTTGYYGLYYNLPNNHPNILMTGNTNYVVTTKIADANDWYSSKYYAFNRVDSKLNFGTNFFPVNTGLAGDPNFFAVNWRAVVEVPTSGNYKYTVSSDDDSWIYIDDQLITNLGGLHVARVTTGEIYLLKGFHKLEIFYADRSKYVAIFTFVPPTTWKIYPLKNDPTANEVKNLTAGSIYDDNNSNTNTNINTGGSVLGASDYGLGNGVLMKTANSNSVYFLTTDGTRRLFVNEPTFWSWHSGKWSDYNILVVSQSHFDSLKIGKNVTVKPKTRLIRFDNSKIIYEVVDIDRIDYINATDSYYRYGQNWYSQTLTIQKSFENNYYRI